MEEGKKFFNDLPTWAKGALVVGGMVGAYYLIKGVAKLPEKIKGAGLDRSEDRAWNEEFDQLNQGEGAATLTKAELKSMANVLETSMDGRGTDEDAIYDTFRRLKNDADFAGLNAAFGRRTVNAGAGYFWDSDFRGNMSSCLREDMDNSEVRKINSILKARGIEYRV